MLFLFIIVMLFINLIMFKGGMLTAFVAIMVINPIAILIMLAMGISSL